MVEYKGSKLNRLLKNWNKGTVLTSAWLVQNGFSRELINNYKKRNWIVSVGRGAYALAEDKVEWTAGLYAIQMQLKLKVHVGSKTSLQMMGISHYLPLGMEVIYLFGSPGEKLPSWFRNYNWDKTVNYSITKLFPPEIALTKKNIGNYFIKLSSPERAIMETLYLVPQKQTYEESTLLMENLITLRPELVQKLLESCNSIKVKRLFMFLAESFGHPWVKRIDLSNVNFGKGKRVIAKGGHFDSKYNISVPKDLF